MTLNRDAGVSIMPVGPTMHGSISPRRLSNDLVGTAAGIGVFTYGNLMPLTMILSPVISGGASKPRDAATVTEALRAGGAREWQVGLTVDVLTDAVNRA